MSDAYAERSFGRLAGGFGEMPGIVIVEFQIAFHKFCRCMARLRLWKKLPVGTMGGGDVAICALVCEPATSVQYSGKIEINVMMTMSTYVSFPARC